MLSSSQIFMLDPVFKGRDNYDQLVKITQVGCVCVCVCVCASVRVKITQVGARVRVKITQVGAGVKVKITQVGGWLGGCVC